MNYREAMKAMTPAWEHSGWKRMGNVFVKPLDERGLINCGFSGRNDPDGYWVDPFVGYHNVEFERFEADVREKKYEPTSVTCSQSLFSLTPEGTYRQWPIRPPTADTDSRTLVEDVSLYGVPFATELHRAGMSGVVRWLEQHPAGSEWRYPIALALQGQWDVAAAMVNRKLQDPLIGEGQSPYAAEYRAFADRFFASSRHGTATDQ